MRRLFLRLYLGILAALALSAFGGTLVALGGFRANVAVKTDRLMAWPALAAIDRLAGATDRELAAAELAAEVGYPVTVRGAEAIPLAAPEREQLATTGHVTRLEGREVWTYARLPDGAVAAMGPLSVVEPDRNGTLLAGVPAVLLGLGAAAWLLLRPLARQLGALARAAEDLGRGQLDARAPILADDASGELAAVFNGMADRIEALAAAREDLLRGVSHDLRTPLARLQFGLELLDGDPDAPTRTARVARMQEDLGLLDERVDTLVRAARARAAPALPEGGESDVTAVVGVVVGAALAGPDATPIAVEAGPDARVAVPPEWLTRALENLVDNAARHARTRIVVRWSVGDDHARIHVDDDGPGIPVEARAAVFEPFHQLDGGRRGGSAPGGDDAPAGRPSRVGTAGLGLAIVRGIAAHAGGRAWAEDAPEGGARLVLELPLAGGASVTNRYAPIHEVHGGAAPRRRR